MKLVKSLVALTALTVSATSAMAYVTGQIYDGKAGLNFGFMHTEQDCKVPNGSGMHKSSFCMMDDVQRTQDQAGMVDAIRKQLDSALDNPSTARVSVAYFSFSNKAVQKKLCELSSKGVSIRVFMDGGDAGAGAQVQTDLVQNPACQDGKGRSNVYLSFLGGSTSAAAGGTWQLHHNKFLMIDPGTGADVKLNFSSGNLSTFGTSLHLDHWVTIEAPATSNLIRAHKCIMQGLESAHKEMKASKNGKQAADAYIKTREECFDDQQIIPRRSGGDTMKQIRAALKQEEIAPVFSPNYDSYVEKALISSIYNLRQGEYLYIAIQHFTSPSVASAIVEASQRGVDIRIVMDDDLYTGTGEVPGVDKVVQGIEAQAPRVQIRYAETNPYTVAGNTSKIAHMMHNKLAIFNGDMTFSGAGHYTGAALKNNWENFYFVTNRGVVTEYAKYFKSLWENSVDKTYAKTGGKVQGQEPAKLSKRFLELAN